MELTEQGGGKQADAVTQIIVDDAENDIATVGVESPDYLDCLHLAKTTEGWRIVKIAFPPRR